MKWFRFYHEFMDDPKIAMMSDSDQLLWVKALCLASDNEKRRGYIDLTDEEICWKLRISVESWKHAIDKFRSKGMLEHIEGGYKILNWDKRQFLSDSSADRVAKYREKQAGKAAKKAVKKLQKQSAEVTVTEQSQPCNVTVTPPDTDTDTDTDTENTPSSSPKGRKRKRSEKKKPAKVSKYHPELCEELFKVWQGMYVQVRGAYEGREGFCKGFDGLIDEGNDVEKIEQGLRFYVESKLSQLNRGEDPIKPPDAVRFFLGKKDHPSSYCLDAYEFKQVRDQGSSEVNESPPPTNPWLTRQDVISDAEAQRIMAIQPAWHRSDEDAEALSVYGRVQWEREQAALQAQGAAA